MSRIKAEYRVLPGLRGEFGPVTRGTLQILTVGAIGGSAFIARALSGSETVGVVTVLVGLALVALPETAVCAGRLSIHEQELVWGARPWSSPRRIARDSVVDVAVSSRGITLLLPEGEEVHLRIAGALSPGFVDQLQEGELLRRSLAPRAQHPP